MTKYDTSKVNDLNLLAKEYFKIRNLDSALYYASIADSISTKINFKRGKCVALNNKGIVYYSAGDYPKSIGYHFEALKLGTEINSLKDIAGSHNGIANVYNYQGEFEKSLEQHFKALRIREQIKDRKEISNSLNGIGNVYQSQGLYTKSLEYHLKSLKIKEEINDVMGQVFSNTNIGNVFIMQEQPEKALTYYKKGLEIFGKTQNPEIESTILNNIGIAYKDVGKYKEALVYYERSLNIYERINSKLGLTQCFLNIGAAYDKIPNDEKALFYFQKALIVSKEIGDEFSISTAESNIGLSYFKLNKIPEAEKYLLSAYSKGLEIGAMTVVRDASNTLRNLYRKKGDFKKALEFQDMYFSTRDSLVNDENTKQNYQSEINYQFEKKAVADSIKGAEEKKLVAAQLKQEKTQRTALYGGLILLLVFAGFMYNRFRITNKQKKIIEIKERETAFQKEIIEEKHKEITDSINYAERIQRSFLATKETLDINLKNYFVLFKPKDVVSGDFYWASKLNNDNFALVTADSTGHGVPGAIMSLLNITSIEKAIETLTQPSEILNATRKTIIARLKKDGSVDGGKDGMDASLIIFDFKNKYLTVSAANNPVWVVRGTEIIEIKPDKMPIGKHDKDTVSFTQTEITIQTGDVIYTLTDGFPDQFGGEKGKKYMIKNLRELLVRNSHLPMHEQKQLLEKTFDDWAENLEQVDDVTIIGVKI
ncbi:MAG: tetratricopeptide repeat protein [Bacteroidia bacterium]|nr:tetratricopeptide repeat protein [Bacteroidia bacterium]